MITRDNYSSVLTLCLLLLCSKSYSQRWIQLDNNPRGKNDFSIEIIESTRSCYKAKITIHGLTERVKLQDGVEFHRLTLTGSRYAFTVGKPELPVITQLIRIPDGTIYKAKVTEVRWKDTQIGMIYPFQKNVLDKDASEKFYKNDSIYSCSRYSPTLLTEGKEMNWRGIRNVGLSICPFMYNPTKGILSILSEFILQVDFTPSKTIERNNLLVHGDDVEDNLCLFANKLPENPGRSTTSNAQYYLNPNKYNYLIIVGDLPGIINSQALADFRRWKAYKGYRTRVVSTADIGSTCDSIKNYIAQEYNNGVRYVLFIGDTDCIPIKVKYVTVNYESRMTRGDYWYGCIVGDDDQQDVAIGRFPTNSLSEVTNIIEKTLYYESTAIPYADNMLLVASGENTEFPIACNNISGAYYSKPLSFTTINGSSGATNLTVTNAINSGMNIINYHGHGGENRWSNWNTLHENFDAYQLQSLEDSVFSVYLANACYTGGISVYNGCLLRDFLCAPNGAVAYIGAADNALSTVDEDYSWAFMNRLVNLNVSTVGDLNMAAHLYAMTPPAGDIDAGTFGAYTYVCGCDPTLNIWTQVPQEMTGIQFDFTAGLNVTSTQISQFSTSVVSEDGDLLDYDKAMYNVTTCYYPYGSYYIVVNKQNYLPYIYHQGTNYNFIQNIVFQEDATYIATPFRIGYDIIPSLTYGNVVVEDGAKLKIKLGSGGLLIKNGFSVEAGGQFIVDY